MATQRLKPYLKTKILRRATLPPMNVTNLPKLQQAKILMVCYIIRSSFVWTEVGSLVWENNVTHRNATGIFPLIMWPCLFKIHVAKGLKFLSIRSMRNSFNTYFPLYLSMLTVEHCWNKINIECNKPSRKHYLHVRSGKQVYVSSMSESLDKNTQNFTHRVAWLSTHGLNCENFDRVKLSRLKYRQLQTNKYLSQFLNWLVSIFSVTDSLIYEYTDAMNIVFQKCLKTSC